MDYTEEAKCESLVMGSRGLGLGKRALLGVSHVMSQRRRVFATHHPILAGHVKARPSRSALCCAMPLHVILCPQTTWMVVA